MNGTDRVLEISVQVVRTGSTTKVSKQFSQDDIRNQSKVYVAVMNQLTNFRDFSNDDIGDIAKVLQQATYAISDYSDSTMAWTVSDDKVLIQYYLTAPNLPNPALEKILDELDRITSG